QSTFSPAKTCRAVSPSTASTTVNPSTSRFARNNFRFVGRSSTIRIFFADDSMLLTLFAHAALHDFAHDLRQSPRVDRLDHVGGGTENQVRQLQMRRIVFDNEDVHGIFRI